LASTLTSVCVWISIVDQAGYKTSLTSADNTVSFHLSEVSTEFTFPFVTKNENIVQVHHCFRHGLDNRQKPPPNGATTHGGINRDHKHKITTRAPSGRPWTRAFTSTTAPLALEQKSAEARGIIGHNMASKTGRVDRQARCSPIVPGSWLAPTESAFRVTPGKYPIHHCTGCLQYGFCIAFLNAFMHENLNRAKQLRNANKPAETGPKRADGLDKKLRQTRIEGKTTEREIIPKITRTRLLSNLCVVALLSKPLSAVIREPWPISEPTYMLPVRCPSKTEAKRDNSPQELLAPEHRVQYHMLVKYVWI
ncbi:hypothetical protein BaRGS_00001807, partial [Batillaria attramentaria]